MDPASSSLLSTALSRGGPYLVTMPRINGLLPWQPWRTALPAGYCACRPLAISGRQMLPRVSCRGLQGDSPSWLLAWITRPCVGDAANAGGLSGDGWRQRTWIVEAEDVDSGGRGRG